MTVKSFIFGPFQTNTYVVSVGEKLFLIDPACSSEYERQVLLNYIEPLAIHHSPLAILATHGHLDHLWGAAWACKQWGGPVYMHEADIPMARAMQQQYDMFGIPAKAEAFEIASLTEYRIQTELQVIHTPGHTPGSVCFYRSEEKTLLSGDTLFCMGFGRTDLPGGNYGQLIQSLDTLFALPPDTLVYPGHGESTTIGAENSRY